MSNDETASSKVGKPIAVRETVKPMPTLETDRLRLRAFSPSDDVVIQVLANDREIAANTRTIPYPYSLENAREWLANHEGAWESGEAAVFGIEIKESGELCGATGLHICSENASAELGYWAGRPYWNQGICSEAARALIKFGFRELGLNRIHAHYLTRNPASGRVMEKIGMKKEGLLRQHVRKWGKFEDIQFYGILKSEIHD